MIPSKPRHWQRKTGSIIRLRLHPFFSVIIFSSIAGAGPIVGPILAATYFGWGPTWVWILIGAIFVGGVHDFGSTFMSLRHGGRSIAEVMKGLVGTRAGKLFLIFVLLALVYVIIVFLDLTLPQLLLNSLLSHLLLDGLF